MSQSQAYQTEFFIKCLMQEEAYPLRPSEDWSDDLWFLDQENRHFEPTKWKIYSDGQATGTLFGGNLCTLNLLQGTGRIKGLLIGRFQNSSKVTEEQLHFILDKHPQLKQIPVLYDLDFGHKQPIATLPIGGELSLDTQNMSLIVSKF